MAEVRFRIEDIKEGDIFYANGIQHIASGDALYYDDYIDGSWISWIVYDTHVKDYFEKDIDCALPDSDEVPEEAKVSLLSPDLALIAKATDMKIHNVNDAERALDMLLKRLAVVMEQNGGQLPPLSSES